MKKLKFLFAVILFLPIATSCYAQDDDFEDWDENQNGQLEKNEFIEKYDHYIYDFEEWDSNGDETLDWPEWNANANDIQVDKGSFQSFDTNGDGYVTEEEFHQATFDLWDANDDEALSETEFEAFKENIY